MIDFSRSEYFEINGCLRGRDSEKMKLNYLCIFEGSTDNMCCLDKSSERDRIEDNDVLVVGVRLCSRK
jgi:hypothetical protein